MATVLLSEKSVIALLNVSRATLKRWAAIGFGPQRIKIGVRRVGYSATEVEEFIAAARAQTVAARRTASKGTAAA